MKKLVSIILLSLLLLPLGAAGQFDTTPPQPTTPPEVIESGPTTVADWFNILQDVVGWLFVIAIILAVLALIIGGIMYITSGGSPDRASTAVRIIIYAIVGVAVVALAWSLVQVVGNFFIAERLVR